MGTKGPKFEENPVFLLVCLKTPFGSGPCRTFRQTIAAIANEKLIKNLRLYQTLVADIGVSFNKPLFPVTPQTVSSDEQSCGDHPHFTEGETSDRPSHPVALSLFLVQNSHVTDRSLANSGRESKRGYRELDMRKSVKKGKRERLVKEDAEKVERTVRGITFLCTEIRNRKLQRKICAENSPTNSSFPSQL